MRILFALLLSAISVSAATIQFGWTNFNATVSTNDLIVTMVRQPINDGSSTVKGLPIRLVTTNGYVQKVLLTGFYSVYPYGLDVEPIIFEVPNDSNTYNYWDLRRSGGHLFVTAGVLGLRAGQGTTLDPTNGVGFVTVTAAGGASNVFVNAGSNSVQVVTNSGNSLFSVSLAFAPMIASSVLSNYATVGTNYWYPTNNPQGFISSNNVPTLFAYQTNAITTNTPAGMTNVVRAIAGSSGSLAGLSDVGFSTLGAGQALKYNSTSGKWTNDVVGSVTSVGVSLPSELSASGSPVTGSGTIAISKANQTANTVWAGPTTGSAAQPTFRALVASDIPAISSTVYASNILSGGNVAQSVLASNTPINGYFLGNSNGFNFWILNAGSLTNYQSANLIGLVPTAKLGDGTATSGRVLRGDQLWTNLIAGQWTVIGNLTNSGNVSFDNGAILSDGSGKLIALKFVGPHYGQGFGLTNVSATNLIDTLSDSRLSSNVPLKNAINVFANNNLFSSSVEFDGGISSLIASVFGTQVGVGATSTVPASNRFDVINAQGRYLFEVQTNGSAWFTTNHYFLIDYDGSFYANGTSNHLVHQLVSESQITANSFFSQNYFGSGAGLSNLTGVAISNAFNPAQFMTASGIVSITNGAPTTNLTIRVTGSANVSNVVSSGHWKIVRGDDVVFMDMSSSGGIDFPQGFSGPIVGSQITSGTVGAAYLPVLGVAYPQAITNNNSYAPTFSGANLTALPALGSMYPNAITNNDARANLKLANGLTVVGTTSIGAGVITNASAAATVYNLGLDASMNITTNIAPVGAVAATAFGWGTNGNNASPIARLGTTNQMAFRIVAFSNEVAVFDTNSTIRMGRDHIIQTNLASDSSIWGGYSNSIADAAFASAILGGHNNTVTGALAIGSIILGGLNNTNQSSAALLGGYGNFIGQNNASVMLGGHGNVICESGNLGSFLGSGTGNWIGTNANSCVLVGGQFNNISNSASYNFLGGGYQNTIGPSAADAVIVGGFQNVANGNFSFAAGNRAKANHQGSFVWSDSEAFDFASQIADTFNIRSTNGVYLSGSGLNVGSTQAVNPGVLVATNRALFGTTNDYATTNVFQVDWTNGQAITVNKTNGSVRIANLVVGTVSAIPYSGFAVAYSTNIASHFADVGNSGTSDTALYTDTIPASTLGVNGYKLYAQYGLNIVSSATATRQIKVFFGGTSIFDSGAVVYLATGTADVDVKIIRDSSTSIRYACRMTATGGTITNFVSVGKLTGLTLSGANTLEIHGQAGGVGAASNDIVATLGNTDFKP